MSKSIINFKILSPTNRSRATNVISQLKDSALVSENTDACLDQSSEVNKNYSARPRLGRLDILPSTTSQATDCKINSKTSRIGTSLPTPAFIFYTQGANLIPHLTPDVAATLIDHSRQFLQAEGAYASDNIATPVLEQKKIRLETHEEENTLQPKINITSIDHYINLPGYSNLSTSFADFNSSEVTKYLVSFS